MYSYKRFNIAFVFMIFLGPILLILVNYIVDPFNIFHTHFLARQFQQNDRFTKTELLATHANRYNSYLLGTSRIGTTEPAYIERYLPGAKFYNCYIAAATMFDNLENLKFIISKGDAPKNIYLQVDILEMLILYKHAPDDYLFHYPPHLLHMNPLIYKMKYLTITPYMNIVGKINQNLHEDFDYARIDFYNTGCWYRDAKENALLQNPEEFVAQEPSFHNPQTRVNKNIHLQENLEDLRKIVEICKQNNINLIIFTTPHNHRLLDSIELDAYLSLLKSLGEISNFWDFSGYNTITTNDTNYYELSHYRPHIAKIIAARIFNDNSVEIPGDFGSFVTQANLNSYLEKKRIDVLQYDKVQSQSRVH